MVETAGVEPASRITLILVIHKFSHVLIFCKPIPAAKLTKAERFDLMSPQRASSITLDGFDFYNLSVVLLKLDRRL